MDSKLGKAVKSRSQCQLHQKAPKEAPLHPWQWLGQPWSRLLIDSAGQYKGHMYLVVIDAYSKWIDVHMKKSTTSAATIEKLREIFATHGLPKNMVLRQLTRIICEKIPASQNIASSHQPQNLTWRLQIQSELSRCVTEVPPLKLLKLNHYDRPETGASLCVLRIMNSNIDVFSFILLVALCN